MHATPRCRLHRGVDLIEKLPVREENCQNSQMFRPTRPLMRPEVV